MAYIPQLLRVKTNTDQFAGNFWFYDAFDGNQAQADCTVAHFFENVNGNPTFRDKDFLYIKATDASAIYTVVVSGLTISLVQISAGGGVTLENDITDITSQVKATTPYYVNQLLGNGPIARNVAFTPFDASGASLVFTNVSGFYSVVNRMVTFNCRLTFPTTASTAGAIIGGLPYPAVSLAGFMVISLTSGFNSAPLASIAVAENQLRVLIGVNYISACQNSLFTAKTITISGSYFI